MNIFEVMNFKYEFRKHQKMMLDKFDQKLGTGRKKVFRFHLVSPPGSGAFLLSIFWGSIGIWIAFLLTEICTFVLILVITKVIAKRSDGSLEGLFLLTRSAAEEYLLDVTIENEKSEAAGLSEKVIQFCLKHEIEAKTANRVGLAVEEMTVNTIEYGYKKNKKNYIDIIVRIKEDEIIIGLRDMGIPFNPTLYKEEENMYSCSGILLVKAMARSVNYSRLIGLNSTIIRLARCQEKDNTGSKND